MCFISPFVYIWCSTSVRLLSTLVRVLRCVSQSEAEPGQSQLWVPPPSPLPPAAVATNHHGSDNPKRKRPGKPNRGWRSVGCVLVHGIGFMCAYFVCS